MSAMKMDFICEDSSLKSATDQREKIKSNSMYTVQGKTSESPTRQDTELNRKQTNGYKNTYTSPTKMKTSNQMALLHKQEDRLQNLSDNENSEDEIPEHNAWEDIELNPATDMITSIVRDGLDAAKTYSKSIAAKATQLITGCDSVLLELQSLSEMRNKNRKHQSKQGKNDRDCFCDVGFSMLPITQQMQNRPTDSDTNDPIVQTSDNPLQTPKKTSLKVDEATEEQTDRILAKLETSMERLRDLAEVIAATNLQGEAHLMSKLKVQDSALETLAMTIQSSAATATAAAIAQERERMHAPTTFSRLFSPLQVKKMQEWYYLYPRPLTDELTLMRTILNYRPYANPLNGSPISIANIREWFKRRRFRERMRYVKLAQEQADNMVDLAAAEEDIDLRIERRIEHLRSTIDPNELVKEMDKVRGGSVLYDTMAINFSRPENIDSYLEASQGDYHGYHYNINRRFNSKRKRTQDADLDETLVVKRATTTEIKAMQCRLRALLARPKSATNTNSLQQLIDLLRSVEISHEVRVKTGVVNDLKTILKAYKKSSLLRKSTIALLDDLGMNRVRSAFDNIGQLGENTPTKEQNGDNVKKSDMHSGSNSRKANDTTATGKSRTKKDRGRRKVRPMKFVMRQVKALEGWFQEKYKPSQTEMEGYLEQLNAPPLRDMEKQTQDVNMTQLRRWFNKRRCLGRPPYALLTQQDAVKDEEGEGIEKPKKKKMRMSNDSKDEELGVDDSEGQSVQTADFDLENDEDDDETVHDGSDDDISPDESSDE